MTILVHLCFTQASFMPSYLLCIGMYYSFFISLIQIELFNYTSPLQTTNVILVFRCSNCTLSDLCLVQLLNTCNGIIPHFVIYESFCYGLWLASFYHYNIITTAEIWQYNRLVCGCSMFSKISIIWIFHAVISCFSINMNV